MKIQGKLEGVIKKIRSEGLAGVQMQSEQKHYLTYKTC